MGSNISSLGSVKRKAKPSAVSISTMRISPVARVKFHRKEAVKSLSKNDFAGYRFHSLKVAKINTNLIIGRARQKKGV